MRQLGFTPKRNAIGPVMHLKIPRNYIDSGNSLHLQSGNINVRTINVHVDWIQVLLNGGSIRKVRSYWD